MNGWPRSLGDGIRSGAMADLALALVLPWRGRRDSGSALAPINASSHVLWGTAAARVERFSLRHTLPGLLINGGAGVFWALVFERLFGRLIDRRGAPAALLGGAATAALAYAVDYKLLPRRFTPGWELRLSGRSLLLALATMAAGMALGALLGRRHSA